MKIYMVRHGISDDHENNKSQSHKSKLSETGKKQAILAANKLSNIDFDIILTSKLTRAIQTAEIIAEKLGKDIEIFEGIHEKEKHPGLHNASYDSDLVKKYKKEFHEHFQEFDWKFEGKGESIRELVERSIRLKNHLVEKHQNQTVLIISHGIFLRAFIVSTLLAEDMNESNFFKLFNSISSDNTGISMFEYDPDRNHWELRFLNDHSHID